MDGSMKDVDYIAPNAHAKLNHMAIRCFRDTGDGDYIAARMANRAGLASQFLWSAEQAIEKYLKCILMLNRVSTLKIGHDISEALKLIETELPFSISLTTSQMEVFNQIADWAADRYLIGSIELRGDELWLFDSIVWRLRQYAQPLDVIHYSDEPSKNVLIENISKIEAGFYGNRKAGFLSGGYLERILADKQNRARAPLVWKNFCFSLKERRILSMSKRFQGINSPFWTNPELAAEASKFMKVPKNILVECQLEVARRCKNSPKK